MVTYAKNASRLHKKVGEILTSCSPWKGFRSEQEVIVSSLFYSFGGKRERYDWVIHDLFTIIECHGKQHYQVQTFGQSAEDAIMNFQSQQRRDAKKEEIAHLNNWTYIAIPYSDEKELSADYLWNIYNLNKCEDPVLAVSAEKAEVDLYKKNKLEKAKLWRHEQYERKKQYKLDNPRD